MGSSPGILLQKWKYNCQQSNLSLTQNCDCHQIKAPSHRHSVWCELKPIWYVTYGEELNKGTIQGAEPYAWDASQTMTIQLTFHCIYSFNESLSQQNY
jgi:hypothetical protein